MPPNSIIERYTTTSHHEPQLSVTITPRIPEADTVQPGHGVLQIRVRCDDEFEGLLAGCVNPAYIPTMTTMAQLPDIATNIRGIQARGGYGVPGKPALALHREADPAEQRQNRDEACNIRVTGPRPAGKSCDEYPFASTKEGGNALPALYHGWDFVPADLQTSKRDSSPASTNRTASSTTIPSTSRSSLPAGPDTTNDRT